MKMRVAGLAAILAVFAATGMAQAEGDADAGKKVFRKCRACHKVEEGKKGVGPHLFGVVDRQVAAVEGYNYSDAMTAFGDGNTWTEELLDSYLTKPKALVPGTKMTFSGLRKEADRANVIAYLKSVQ